MITELRTLILYLRARTGILTADEDGLTLLEYVIMAAIISVAAVAIITYIVGQINAAKGRITTGG
jgi:Flp pilus assembly pilin Flp